MCVWDRFFCRLHVYSKTDLQTHHAFPPIVSDCNRLRYRTMGICPLHHGASGGRQSGIPGLEQHHLVSTMGPYRLRPRSWCLYLVASREINRSKYQKKEDGSERTRPLIFKPGKEIGVSWPIDERLRLDNQLHPDQKMRHDNRGKISGKFSGHRHLA